MPIQETTRTGNCANCGQAWAVTYAAFDVYCPECHTLVMPLSAADRLINATLVAAAVVVFEVLLSLPLVRWFGREALVIGLVLGGVAGLATAMWTYRAARTHRTVARPVSRAMRGLPRV